MNQLLVVVVCVSVFVGTSYGRLNRDAMREALGQDPLFSHQRDRAVPVAQNVNIELPISDPAVQEQRAAVPVQRPTVQAAENRPIVKTRPAKAESRNRGRGVAKQQNRGGIPIIAGKPVRQQELVMGQKAPTRVAQQQPSVPVPAKTQQNAVSNSMNDRMFNSVRPAASSAPVEQQVADSKKECSFHIPSFMLPNPDPSRVGTSQRCPSFLLPGPRINPDLVNLMVEHWTGVSHTGNSQLTSVKSQITQVEFEQKCLIPALSAHVLGGPACRSRELKVYLEWLLYLRQRLFNI